ncbi:MAG: PAS domain-containing protein [Muribaculaceae bacterium]|nr:PAS domain-containing protein [Muribaculaceae bacterium]
MERIEDNINKIVPDWAMGMNCAVTVCDADCRIVYMNQRARDTFSNGDDSLIGQNLLDCHNPHSVGIIKRLLAEGGVNCYTISKRGQKKLIYQTAWKSESGAVGGLVELSMVIPENMPHFDRG